MYTHHILMLLVFAWYLNVPAYAARPAPQARLSCPSSVSSITWLIASKSTEPNLTPTSMVGKPASQSSLLSPRPLSQPRKSQARKAYSLNDLSTIYHLVVESQRLYQLKQESKARVLLYKAITSDPNPYSAYAHHTLGVMLDNNDDTLSALKEYEIAATYAPKSPHLLLLLGIRYKNLGQIPKSIHWFEKYITLCPGAPDTAQLRAWINTTKERGLDCTEADLSSPDYLKKAAGRPPRVWPPGRFPLKVFIQSGQQVSGYHPQYRKLLIAAFQDWSKAVPNCISWRLTSDKTEADIVCSWVSAQSQFAGGDKGSAAGLTRYWQWGDDEAVVDKAEIQIWTMCPGDTEIKQTCLHEVGHALGLEHSPNPKDAMYYMVSYHPPAALSERDKSTLQRLYAEHRAFKTPHNQSHANMISHTAGN